MRKQDLTQALKVVSRDVSEKTLMSISSSLFEAVDSPRSLALHILLKNKEYAQLVNMEIDPGNYAHSERFANDYLVTKFLSKFPGFVHDELDPEAAALSSFFKYEEACEVTNRKFRELEEDPHKWDPTMKGILYLARRKISSVLGKPDLSEIAKHFAWGPGATTSTSGNHTSAYVKFKSRLDVTSNSLVIGMCCVNSTPSWVNCQLQADEFPSVEASLTAGAFNIVRGNEIVFVPKNAKTHRIIAKEPHVNSYLQKGFGTYIRKRLRSVAGVNLKDQTRNQQLAKEGSVTGRLATIDLSGASDTISYELVKFLLPGSWFSLLSRLRSAQGLLMGDWIHYKKFSSMGNAYTFELESLIFWALCSAVQEINGGEQTLSVYGDDLIVPVEHYESVVKVIDFVGFSVNESKSFHSGPFRESCGKDYFLGTDVRPIFLKEIISNVESLYKLANNVRRLAHRRNSRCGCDQRLLHPWLAVVDRIPKALRGYRIPEGFGDSGLIANLDEALPSLLRQKRGWGGYLFKAIVRIPVKLDMRDRNAGYTATLYGIGAKQQQPVQWVNADGAKLYQWPETRLEGESLVSFIDRTVFSDAKPPLGRHDLRRRTTPKVTRIHTHGWYDLGPWE